MEMKKILGLSERLIALIEKAQAEANMIVSKAQKEADESLEEVKAETEKKRLRAQRRTGLDEFLVDAEAEAKKEATKVKKDYAKRIKEIRGTSDDKIKEAVDHVLKEVVPQ
jgi:vacuolar-type H+-ATPase subunit H